MKNKINKIKGYAIRLAPGLVAGATALFWGAMAHAQVDTDIQNAGAAMATSTKENLVGLVTSNINYVAIIFALSLGLLFLMKLFRRSAR